MQNEVQKEMKTPIIFEAEDFNIEDFNVKPLSKGLGFHKSKERVQQQLKLNKKPPVTNSTITKKPQVLPVATSATIAKENLSSFYQRTQETYKSYDKNDEANETPINTQDATLLIRSAAWCLDFILIIFVNIALMGTFVLSAGLAFNLETVTSVFSVLELVTFSSLMFSLIYIFYFTILDLSSSPGKSLLGVVLVSAELKSPSASQTFVRAVVSLFSFLAAGLPLFLDFQSKLSDTRVIKDAA